MPSDCVSIETCDRNIAEVEALILAGHPDVEGLCLALSDWSWAKRLIEARVRAEVEGTGQ